MKIKYLFHILILSIILSYPFLSNADNPKVTMDEYDDVQWLIYSGNTANKATGLIVRNEDNSASGRNIAGFYLRTNNGAGGEYNSSMHAYGENYEVPAFRGYVNFSCDGGNGTILRSIHANAPEANVQIFAGDTGGFSDAVAIFHGDKRTEIKGDINTVARTDYSSISTIVGWDSFTTKRLNYKKLGNLVFVDFHLAGDSNNSTTSFSLPYAITGDCSGFRAIAFAEDNGVNVSNGSLLILSYNVVSCYKGVDGGAFSSSGNKRVIGQFWYETD